MYQHMASDAMRTTIDLDPVILAALEKRQVAERKGLSVLVYPRVRGLRRFDGIGVIDAPA